MPSTSAMSAGSPPRSMRFGRDFGVGLVAPDEGGERAGLVDQFARPLGVVDDQFDLAAMAHDAGVGEAALDVAFDRTARSLRNRSRRRRRGNSPASAGSSATRVPTGNPSRQSFSNRRMSSLDRAAPLRVVVAEIERVRAGPPAARQAVRPCDHPCRKSLGHRHLDRHFAAPLAAIKKGFRTLLHKRSRNHHASGVNRLHRRAPRSP